MVLNRWYGIDRLRSYSIWRHVESDSLYVVVGIAMKALENGVEMREESVIYHEVSLNSLKYMLVHEFLDGRFELVEGSKNGKHQGY